ncbi:hypothetical protein [Streptomyces sp. NPDC048192]|uniref:hypothetical protein n=1 Tax=Streptomyces sp. NPDC048192 TaxID=3365510 RepID=UPI00371EFFAC
MRPTYCKPPSSSYLPSSSVRAAASEPVTAPTIASLVSQILYFSQPRTDGL